MLGFVCNMLGLVCKLYTCTYVRVCMQYATWFVYKLYTCTYARVCSNMQHARVCSLDC